MQTCNLISDFFTTMQEINEDKGTKVAQVPYKPMQQAPRMPQTPYAYAKKANAPIANRPTYAGAPMMANNKEK